VVSRSSTTIFGTKSHRFEEETWPPAQHCRLGHKSRMPIASGRILLAHVIDTKEKILWSLCVQTSRWIGNGKLTDCQHLDFFCREWVSLMASQEVPAYKIAKRFQQNLFKSSGCG
jgi:hypothetical protein